MSDVSFRIKQDKQVAVTSVVVTIKKFLFSKCDCTVDSNVGKVDFSLVL